MKSFSKRYIRKGFTLLYVYSSELNRKKRKKELIKGKALLKDVGKENEQRKYMHGVIRRAVRRMMAD